MRLPLPGHAGRLRLLVLAVSDRCDQRCAHCQIWMGGQDAARPRGLGLEERLAVVEDAIRAGVEEALLTGGEPLLSWDLWPVAERLQRAGVRLMLATNGMLLVGQAARVAALFAEVYVSLDGATAATYEAIRGAGTSARLQAGVRALRAASKSVRIVARATLNARNLGEVAAIVGTARRMGFDQVSFLPMDASSPAFGARPETRRALLPTPAAVRDFEARVARMQAEGTFADGFVAEPPGKLLGFARYFLAAHGRSGYERPECDAPWWSSVVEADGSLRPCFFHDTAGDARDGLALVRASRRYREALASVKEANPVCQRCVCPKRRGLGLLDRLLA